MILTGRRADTEKVMVRLLSPSPTLSDAGSTRNADIGGNGLASYIAAKESKVIVEKILLCLEKQIEYYKYVLTSETCDAN